VSENKCGPLDSAYQSSRKYVSEMMGIEDARSELPVTRKYVCLNNTSVGPLPIAAAEAVRFVTEEKFDGELSWDH